MLRRLQRTLGAPARHLGLATAAAVVGLFAAAAPGGSLSLAGASPVAASATYPTTVLTDSPAAYWRLAERSGTVVTDATGRGYTGTITGSVALGAPGAITGLPDTAMTFSGGSIGTSFVQSSITAYSEEVWINTTSTAPYGVVFADRGADGSGHSISLYIGRTGGQHGGPGQVSFELDTNNREIGQTSLQAINDGHWHHVVGVWSAPAGTTLDPSQFQLYIDGQLAPTTASESNGCGCTPASPLSGNGGVQIGLFGFAGQLAEMAIYTTALPAARVAAHYQVALAASPPSSGGPGCRVDDEDQRQLAHHPISRGAVQAHAHRHRHDADHDSRCHDDDPPAQHPRKR
jgi:hypothetical protein